jgi:hypothetical protein
MEGTAEFILNEGGDSNRLLLVTARHVVLPGSDNKSYNVSRTLSESQARWDVMILSDPSFKQHLAFIKGEVNEQSDVIEYQTDRIERMADVVADRTDDEAVRGRQDGSNAIESAKETENVLNGFHHQLTTQWATYDRRVIRP